MHQKNCFHFRLPKKVKIEFCPYYTETEILRCYYVDNIVL